MTNILKFLHECTSILATQVDSPSLTLRLFLLATQIASECGSGFEDRAYDLYVQAFQCTKTRFQTAEHSCPLIIGTSQGAKVFEVDAYDTLRKGKGKGKGKGKERIGRVRPRR
jgi:vacuolar protein sorting-associated protein 35